MAERWIGAAQEHLNQAPRRAMADVFISYSRRDEEFVHRLHDALTERDREVWVDTPLASSTRTGVDT